MTKATGLIAIGLFIFGFGGLPGCKKTSQDASNTATAGKTLYHCAMHPEIIRDKPGECPICHMKLTPIENVTEPAKPDPAKPLFYRNPMDPTVTSPVPMKDSMGMDYIPVYPETAPQASSVPGQAAVQMRPDVEQRIGVQTSDAQKRDLVLPVRAAARVAYDPQLYSAALEHREARKFLDQAKGDESREQADATVRSSELRLRQMGLSDQQIDEISRPKYDASSLLLGSRGGKIWVYADVYDNQVAAVRAGQPVEITSPALPGKTLKGVVRGIDPVVNAETRTVRVRIQAENPEGQLKPGIYVSAVIRASLGQALTVPESAIIDTGTRQLVYVQTQPGTYEPRVVRIGREADGFVEIIEGVKPGEKVANSGNFLIDSESRIQSAVQGANK